MDFGKVGERNDVCFYLHRMWACENGERTAQGTVSKLRSYDGGGTQELLGVDCIGERAAKAGDSLLLRLQGERKIASLSTDAQVRPH